MRSEAPGSSWLSKGDVSRTDDLFGHFLCFDRWGPVTTEEKAAGHRFHGEAARVEWTAVAPDPPLGLMLETTLPVSGLRARRGYHLPSGPGCIQIFTTVENPGSVARPYNLVEHVTLADSWNHPEVRLLTAAFRGVVHVKGQPVPKAEAVWPNLRLAGEQWDLRGEVNRRGRTVVSLTFPEESEWGWVCLLDPRQSRLLAYVWRTADFPWLNLYWHGDGQRVLRRAIEPGTTGLHQPMSVLLKTPPTLDRAVVRHLVAGESRTRAMWGFMAELPREMLGQIVGLERTAAGWSVRMETGGFVPLESIN